MKKKPNWFLIVGLSLGGLCLVGCILAAVLVRYYPTLRQIKINNSSLAVGESAPDFELTALTGETVRLSQFRGQPVLLTFGTSWCPSCRGEAPLVENLHQSHPDLVILLVDGKESREVVREYVDEIGITYPVLLDEDGEINELYQIYAIPTNLFIDADGVIRAKLIERVTPDLLAENLPLIGVNP